MSADMSKAEADMMRSLGRATRALRETTDALAEIVAALDNGHEIGSLRAARAAILKAEEVLGS